MIDNNKKIEKLNILLTYAILQISPYHIMMDKDEVWSLIDKIIKINDYIEKLKSNIPDQEKQTNEPSLYHS